MPTDRLRHHCPEAEPAPRELRVVKMIRVKEEVGLGMINIIDPMEEREERSRDLHRMTTFEGSKRGTFRFPASVDYIPHVKGESQMSNQNERRLLQNRLLPKNTCCGS